jgi:hypothetical protein
VDIGKKDTRIRFHLKDIFLPTSMKTVSKLVGNTILLVANHPGVGKALRRLLQ